MNLTVFDIVYVLFILLLFAGVILCGVKPLPALDGQEACQRLNNLRGIFAMEIVVGHVIRDDRTLLYPMGKFMIISVAFFFFVSAFGLVRSFHKKEGYLKNFLIPKAGYLFCLAIVVYGINILLDYIIPGELGYFKSWREMLIAFPSKTNWYLWEQIFFYILFYLAYRFLKRYRILCITLVTIIFMNIVFGLGWKQGFYSSSLAFPLGLLYGEYYEKCQNILRCWIGKAITVTLVAAGLCSQLLGQNSLIGMVWLRNAMCMGGILLILYIISSFKFDNIVMQILGKYSTEIYLMQFVFLAMLARTEGDYKIRILFVVGMTLLAAVIAHPLFEAVGKMVGRGVKIGVERNVQ